MNLSHDHRRSLPRPIPPKSAYGPGTHAKSACAKSPSVARLRAVIHEQEGRLPARGLQAKAWQAAKIFWTVMSMNYAVFAFYVRPPLS